MSTDFSRMWSETAIEGVFISKDAAIQECGCIWYKDADMQCHEVKVGMQPETVKPVRGRIRTRQPEVKPAKKVRRGFGSY